MMANYELRLFANPSGFQPMNLNYAYEMFTQDVVDKRNLDGERGTFKEGTFSVFYIPEAFIIDYQFSVVKEANFRANEAHFSIAIRRGWKIEHAKSMFDALRKEFNKFVSIEKEFSNQSIYKKLPDFNKIIEGYISESDQPQINTGSIDVRKRAIVAYDNDNELDSLLEKPNRIAFRGYSILFLIARSEANEIYQSVRENGYTPIAEYEKELQYELVFPDKYIEKLKSKNDTVNHICSLPYHEPIIFEGNLIEHWKEWNVTQDKEGIRLIIGKMPSPKIKEIRVICKDKSGKEIPPPPNLTFDYGTFNCQDRILVIKGDELSKTIMPKESDNPSVAFFSNGLPPNATSVEIVVRNVYQYDISSYIKHINKTNDEDVQVEVHECRNKSLIQVLDKFHATFKSIYDITELYLRIPDTKKYEEKNIKFEELQRVEPQNIVRLLQRKGTVTIELTITNIDKIKLASDSRVILSYKLIHDKESDAVYPHEVSFGEDGHLVLEDMSKGNLFLEIKAKGYKTITKEINLNPQNKKIIQENIELEKTIGKKSLDFMTKHKGNVAILLIGLVIGGFLRPYLDEKLNLPHNNNNRNMDLLRVERDSLLTLTKILKNDTTILGQKNDSLELKIVELETTVDNYKEAINQVQELARGINNEETHPNEIRNILTQMSNKDIEDLKVGRTNKNWFYKNVYNKLNNVERKDLDMILDNDVYYSTFTSDNNRVQTFKGAKTFKDAINIIKIKSGS